MRLNTLFIAVAMLVLTGCFSGSSSAPTEIAPPQTSTTTTESIFPHKSNWKDPAQHGIYVKDSLQYDTSSCTTCHDANGTANPAKGGAPGCRSCHSVFPHTDSDVTLETHGLYVVKNGKTACATQCHGTDLKGGLNEVACTKCHTTYPHDSGWATPSVHGPMAKGNLKLKCALCHGDNYNGGTSKVSCVSCHKDNYPHPAGWASPDQHGAFAVKNGTGKCATQCHGAQLDGGLSGVSCITCHNIWPHSKDNWMGKHGEQAQVIGISGCMGCHKNDATGGTTGVTCTQCHSTLASHQDATWATADHGSLVMQNPSALTDSKGCPLCHGTNLQGGKQPSLPLIKPVPGCNSCHATYPTLHKSAVGTPAWNSADGHAKWVMSQVDISKGGVLNQINTLVTNCKLCHGADLKGGTVGKSCYTCHTTFPHSSDPTTPWLSMHGAAATAENPKASSCASANCHGTDLKGLPVGEKDVTKKLVRGCADCHIQMPHQPLGQWDHGKSVVIAGTGLLDATKCSSCHGATWTGSDAAPSCTKCHSNYPLPHRKADGSSDPLWKTPSGHGATVLAASGVTTKDKVTALGCTTCHGNDLAGGSSGVSCYKCHNVYPHAPTTSFTVNALGKPTTVSFTDANWSGFDKGHGLYVAAKAKLNNVTVVQQLKTECATSCHGSDLLGGTSGKSCTTCHPSFPHTANWSDASNHGLYALKLKNGVNGTTDVKKACWTNCHGTQGGGGFAGANNCGICHSTYPHPTGWKDDKSANATYSPHALAVIDTYGTPTKNDDVFNASHFGQCAACHGQTLSLLKEETYPLPDGDKTLITIEPGLTVKRCTACHIYPHQQIQAYNYVPTDWKKGHGVPLFYWIVNPGFSVPNSTCGTAEGKAGGHTSGPTATVPGKEIIKDIDGCNFCHK